MKRKTATPKLRTKRARIEKELNRRDRSKNPAIVEINCSDYLSLYRAIRVGKHYYEKGGGKWEPSARLATSSRLSSKDIDLWNLLDGPLEQTSYSLGDVQKAYKYLDTTHPEMYRILVFTDTSGTSTVYNSGNNARHSICLYYLDGHFDLIKTPQKLFRKRHYCVDCEISYEDLKNHSDCKIRCRQCFRSGYGYPCMGDMDLECPDCHKLFPSQDCLKAHKPYSCNTYHRCIYCNVQYRVRPERPSKGHRCDKKDSLTSSTITEKHDSVLEALQQDIASSANVVSTRPAGRVQQSILPWLVKMS
ncbi:hypothetical protein AAVH_39675 [Aphelenchoides avenae]|nr:hypothetical protein AAVH_39675 [Aphelenchus avenae]